MKLHKQWRAYYTQCTRIQYSRSIKLRLTTVGDPPRWPRDTPLSTKDWHWGSSTSGGRSVGRVRSRTEGHGVFCIQYRMKKKPSSPCKYPWRPTLLWDIEDRTLSRHTVIVGSYRVSVTHRPPFTPRMSSGTHSCYRLTKLCGRSAAGMIRYIVLNSVTSCGVEPATFRFVA
jgi:hypothetical protein